MALQPLKAIVEAKASKVNGLVNCLETKVRSVISKVLPVYYRCCYGHSKTGQIRILDMAVQTLELEC